MPGARRARRSFGRRSRPAVYWTGDSIDEQTNTVPAVTLDRQNRQQQRAISMWLPSLSQERAINDLLVHRTILSVLITGDYQAGATPEASLNGNLVVCIGYEFMRNEGVADGIFTNTFFATDQGPLGEGTRKRWLVRCCLSIPIGQMALAGAGVSSPGMIREGMGWGYDLSLNTFWVWCEWDGKAKRRLEGGAPTNGTLVLAAKVSDSDFAAGTDLWNLVVSQASVRHVVSRPTRA